MICGRCKARAVDVAHVRACYRTSPGSNRAKASDLSGPGSGLAHAEPRGGGRGATHQGRRGPRQRDNPWTWQPAVGPIESAIERGVSSDGFGGGMDADGGTPRLRALESEFGFDAMLYEWRDEPDYD